MWSPGSCGRTVVSTMVTGLDQASPFLDRKASPADHISSATKQALQRAKSSML